MGDRIALGSGKLYISTWDGLTIPADLTLETDANLLGKIEGGASLQYKPSYYEAKDDYNTINKRIITDEEVILSTGIMTINAKTINKLISTGKLTETSTERTLKIGGSANFIDSKYVLHFVHSDSVDGDIRISIVGSNQGSLDLAFKKDKEVIIGVEFKARAMDSQGTLVIYREKIPA